MKKFLLLWIFSAACFFSNAQTNIYHPFPDSSAHWNLYSVQYYGCSIWQNYEEWLSIVISDDTIITNKNYHKLEIPFLQKNCLTGSAGHHTGYQGAIRQDTSLKQVFFVNRFDSTEQLLYDFNLEVGDTVKGFLVSSVWGCWPGDITVISMDSILVGGGYRKRWQLSYFSVEIIEGIGSTRGLIDPVCEIIDGPEITLNCYTRNDSVLYTTSATTCDLINSIQNVKQFNSQISISPNPFHSEGKLEIGNWKMETGLLTIYNSMGMRVREEKISNLNSYTLRRDGMNDDLYFYELRSENYELLGSGKFIVE